MEELQVLLLHKNPEYTKACCDLLNDEWPRSETARLMSLQASCDNLPTSLVLINETKVVLGHCKLTPIPSIPASCFIEAVVINKKLRGQKLGTFLMKHAEQYCRDVLHLKMMHLSTKGQEKFYEKLGYEVCAPVSIYGGCAPPRKLVDSSCSKKSDEKSKDSTTTFTTKGVPPPPPPPPMPKQNNDVVTLKSSKTFMFKYL